MDIKQTRYFLSQDRILSPAVLSTMSRSSSMTADEDRRLDDLLKRMGHEPRRWEDSGYPDAEEWRIVGKTVERCLFILFFLTFIIGSLIILTNEADITDDALQHEHPSKE